MGHFFNTQSLVSSAFFPLRGLLQFFLYLLVTQKPVVQEARPPISRSFWKTPS